MPVVAVIVVVFVPDEVVDGSARAADECGKSNTANTSRKNGNLKGLQLLCSNIIILLQFVGYNNFRPEDSLGFVRETTRNTK